MILRRTIVLGLAILAVTPAFAQSDRTTSGQASSGNMDAAEQKHIDDTLAAGSLSLATSRLAVNRVKGSRLLEFARFEVAEQETIADVLNAMTGGS